jgi:hypothetical protein
VINKISLKILRNFPVLLIANTIKLYIHLNIASLPFHIDKLCSLINSLNSFPLALGITESNLYLNNTNITDININGFNIEHCPTEARKGGALLYLR